MKKFNRDKMLRLGTWLEHFLNPKLESNDYRILAENAGNILNIDYTFKKNEATTHLIEFITSSQEWNIRDADGIIVSEFLNNMIEEAQIGLYLTNKMGLSDPLNEEENGTPSEIWFIEDSLWDIYWLLIYKFEIIPSILKTILKSDQHWDVEIAVATPNFDKLIEGYKYISKEIYFKDSKIGNTNVFVGVPDWTDQVSFFPWLTILSHIFFGFLLNGGQYYCAFCEQCGRFTVLKRKNKKKYCSDQCRCLFNYLKNK